MEKIFFHPLQLEIDFISYLIIPKFIFYNNNNSIYSFVNIRMIKIKNELNYFMYTVVLVLI